MKRYRITVQEHTFDVEVLSDPRQAEVQVKVDGKQEIWEIHDECYGDYLSPELLDKLDCRLHRSAGGDEIVDHEDSLPGLYGIHVHLDDIGAILGLVLLSDRLVWEFPRLPHRNESRAELKCQRGSYDEAPGLDPHDDVDLIVDEEACKLLYCVPEDLVVLDQGRDVAEHYPLSGEIGNGPDSVLDVLHVHRHHPAQRLRFPLIDIARRRRIASRHP